MPMKLLAPLAQAPLPRRSTSSPRSRPVTSGWPFGSFVPFAFDDLDDIEKIRVLKARKHVQASIPPWVSVQHTHLEFPSFA
jgi:hypothetical protein